MSNLTQVVNTDKNLKTLKRSIHASDMDQLLSSTGPFTFFAPLDSAFEKLEKGMLDNLLEPQNRGKLANLINNHVVNGKVNFKDLKDGDTLKTLNGKELQIGIKDGKINIGTIAVQPRDAKISNGVMYSVDTVFNE
jgi:uncharacterized surface protein with fasciclin (FAS1) repeats